MIRTALIQNGHIMTVVMAPAGWTPPPGHTAMPEAQAIAQDIPRAPAPEPPVPEEVTPRKFRLAALAAGIDPEMVDARIADIPEPVQRRAAEIEWTYASAIRRDHPLVAAMAAALGLAEQDVDDLFRAAAQIPD